MVKGQACRGEEEVVDRVRRRRRVQRDDALADTCDSVTRRYPRSPGASASAVPAPSRGDGTIEVGDPGRVGRRVLADDVHDAIASDAGGSRRTGVETNVVH